MGWVAFVLTLLAMVLAPLAGWCGGRLLSRGLVAAGLLFVLNLVLAWTADDLPGVTIEGGASGWGILLAVALLSTTLMFAAVGCAARLLVERLAR